MAHHQEQHVSGSSSSYYQEARRHCVNNCGFFGHPSTQDLCSKCYREKILFTPSSSTAPHHPIFSFVSANAVNLNRNLKVPTAVEDDVQKGEVTERAVVVPQQQQPNRCLTCKKRVGLMGFNCRCGMVFCPTHRYPEQHGCEFDFKSLGKQQIAIANPVIKGEKLQKI